MYFAFLEIYNKLLVLRKGDWAMPDTKIPLDVSYTYLIHIALKMQ